MSYISNPQSNASLLAEILTKMNPAQHDAVILLNGLAETVANLTYVSVSSMVREYSDWQDAQAQIGNVAELVTTAIKHGMEINALIDAIAGNTALGFSNGQVINDLAAALVENLTLSINNGQSINSVVAALTENLTLSLGNGQAVNDLAAALTETLTLSQSNGVASNAALGLGIENLTADIQQAQHKIKDKI